MPRTTDRQKETGDLERRRARLQDELDRWRQARAKDVKVYQDMVRNAATNDPSGKGRGTYREMHLQCDRIWVERIQLKKAELATLAAGARRDRNPEPAPIIFDASNVKD